MDAKPPLRGTTSLTEVATNFSPSYPNARIPGLLIPDVGISDHTNSSLFWNETLFCLLQLQVKNPTNARTLTEALTLPALPEAYSYRKGDT